MIMITQITEKGGMMNMYKLRILSDHDIRLLLDIKSTIHCVETAYIKKVTNMDRLFPIISENLIEGKAEFDIKSGILRDSGIFGLKVASWFGDNVYHDIPALSGVMMLFDTEYGMPKAILNSRYLTAMRTGAAGAIGAKYLARKGSRALLIIGTGGQAIFQIASTLSAIPSIDKVLLYDPLNYKKVLDFKESIPLILGETINDHHDQENILWKQRFESVDYVAVNNLEMALTKADVVITATPSRRPIISKEWVKPGMHFSCVGADTIGKQEIDEHIFKGAKVFVDDIAQASSVGESQTAIQEDIINKKCLNEIGQLLNKESKGRINDSDITIFDTTGIAIQDLEVGRLVIQRAEEKKIGKIVEI